MVSLVRTGEPAPGHAVRPPPSTRRTGPAGGRPGGISRRPPRGPGGGRGGVVAPAEGGQEAVGGRAGGGLVAGQDAADGLAGGDPVAELGRELDGHGRVDVVVLALPAGAEGGRDPAHGLGVDRRQPAVPGAGTSLVTRAWGRIDRSSATGGRPWAATNWRNLSRPSPDSRAMGVAAARLRVGRGAGQGGQMPGEGQAEVEEPPGAASPAAPPPPPGPRRRCRPAPRRLAHVGDQGGGGAAGVLPDLDADPGQLDRGRGLAHERPRAGLDVEQDAGRPAGQLLAHHAGGDQGDVADGGGHVAEGVDRLVGRDQVGGLGGRGQTDALDLVEQLVDAQVDPEAGDRLQLVEVPPVWPRPRPGA